MEKEKFTLLLMKDAEDFLRSIPDNAKDKIYYNIYKIQMGGSAIVRFSRSLENPTFGSFARYMTKRRTDCLLFGTRKKIRL